MNEIMLREMEDQATAIRRAVIYMRGQARSIGTAPRPGRIFLTGSGDSFIAARAVEALYREHVDAEVRVVASLQGSRFEAYRATDLVVVVSVSGQVSRSVEAALVAREQGATVVAIVARHGSDLGEAAEFQVIMPEPMTRTTPHTRDYTLTLAALAVVLEPLVDVQFAELERWPDIIHQVLHSAFRRIPGWACSSDLTWFFGGGPDRASALYGALKYWEAGLRAWSDDLEEFAHGSQLMARPGDVAVVMAVGQAHDRALEMLSGMRRMELRPWILSDRAIDGEPDALVVPSLGGSAWSPFTTCIPLQVLTYLAVQEQSVDATTRLGGSAYGALLESVHAEWTKSSKIVVAQ